MTKAFCCSGSSTLIPLVNVQGHHIEIVFCACVCVSTQCRWWLVKTVSLTTSRTETRDTGFTFWSESTQRWIPESKPESTDTALTDHESHVTRKFSTFTNITRENHAKLAPKVTFGGVQNALRRLFTFLLLFWDRQRPSSNT